MLLAMTSHRALLLAAFSLALAPLAGCSDSNTTPSGADMTVGDTRCAPLAACGKACSVDAECVSAGDVGQCVRVAAGTFCISSCVVSRVSCPAGYECKASSDSFRCLKPCQSDSECTESQSRCCGNYCVGLASDRNNCKTCGNVCPARDNAVAACQDGVCGFSRCLAGFSDCDSDETNGCETNITNDINNCGGCALACSPPEGAGSTCVDRKCGITCNAGRGDCNGNTTDGCEKDLQTDNGNCGACNIVCQNGTTCTAGKCV